MARKRRRVLSRPARRITTQSLGHTAGRSLGRIEPLRLGPPPEAVYRSPVRSPLIRTVLIEPARGYQSPPQRGRPNSPLVPVRATGRSSDRRTRSPFLNATMLTPELTERALICARRNIRKEVLFANRQTGKGARSPKRTPSKVRC